MLKAVSAIAGYTTYIELIRPLIQNKKIISTAMKKEVDRASEALDLALSGTPCAVVSSGDAGIYAMAGLVLEMCRERSISIHAPACGSDTDENSVHGQDRTPVKSETALEIEVVPGIPALCAGASLLGAPLTHDFAAISLSDLLTPWEVIAARLDAAAKADFVIVLYNPKSRKRTDHIARAQAILLQYRSAATPVGVVTGAMRENQRVRITTLEQLHQAEVDMQTTVFIGNAATFCYDGFMVTPRGYTEKYQIG